MRQIEIKILNPEIAESNRKLLVTAARLTQRSHSINNLDDFIYLSNLEYTDELLRKLCTLPHPTLQKLNVINIVIVGASRRFLSQITRHQNEVKFVSGSLQYSNYSSTSQFVIPYELTSNCDEYISSCETSMSAYKNIIDYGIDNDTAGYVAPQSLRNVLIISATPYQWKHMISQRICRRNTDETRYVMLKIWEQLNLLDDIIFGSTVGSDCMIDKCKEGSMSCHNPINKTFNPTDILKNDFSNFYTDEGTINDES